MFSNLVVIVLIFIFFLGFFCKSCHSFQYHPLITTLFFCDGLGLITRKKNNKT
jgi:hypothetical protein